MRTPDNKRLERTATVRFSASAAYLLNEAASLARLRFAPPLGLGVSRQACLRLKSGGPLISRAVSPWTEL